MTHHELLITILSGIVLFQCVTIYRMRLQRDRWRRRTLNQLREKSIALHPLFHDTQIDVVDV